MSDSKEQEVNLITKGGTEEKGRTFEEFVEEIRGTRFDCTVFLPGGDVRFYRSNT